MGPEVITLILRLSDLALWAMQRLPKRNAETEAALKEITEMIENGEVPTQEDFERVLSEIEVLSQERDNIIALKPE